MTPPLIAHFVLLMLARLNGRRAAEIRDHLLDQYAAKLVSGHWTRERADRWYGRTVLLHAPSLLSEPLRQVAYGYWAFTASFLTVLSGMAGATLFAYVLDRIAPHASMMLISTTFYVLLGLTYFGAGLTTGIAGSRMARTTTLASLAVYLMLLTAGGHRPASGAFILCVIVSFTAGAALGCRWNVAIRFAERYILPPILG